MKSAAHVLLILLSIVLLIISCKKHSDNEVVVNVKQDTCVAGTPGNLTIKVTLQHHEHTLVNQENYRDTVYVKYNVQEFPGMNPAAYDTIYIGEYPGDKVLLTNLRCGKYYLFGVGSEPIHFVRVYGGIPYSTELKEGEVSITIPVSE